MTAPPPARPVDVDTLPPTQYLILEVLAARHRTGEHLWTFPKRLTPQMRALERAGLVGWRGGVAPATVQAWLTDAGRAAALMDGYMTPLDAAHEKMRQAGREDAARDILDHPGPNPSPASPTWWAGYAEARADAARVARGPQVAVVAAAPDSAGRERIAQYLEDAATGMRRTGLLGDMVTANAWAEAARLCRDDTIWADSPEEEER